MELENHTGLPVGATLGLREGGREHLIVCVKGTFRFTSDGGEAVSAEEQEPLHEADAFTGEPGRSAPLHEADYAPHKPACDVLIRGSAHAPGRPAERVIVGIRVGRLSKSFAVVGQRTWEKGRSGIKPSEPRRFSVMPIGYERAFGGADGPGKEARVFPSNPVGIGFRAARDDEAITGEPLPNTEEESKSIEDPFAIHRPMSFGPIGRSWQPRIQLAGTYDQAWRDDVFPFLPADFDERYHQSAPVDQQMPYPRGGEEVLLTNLRPEGPARFRLPKARVPVEITMKKGERRELTAVVDTIVLSPEKRRLTLVYRTSTPIRQSLLEIGRIVIGQRGGGA